MGSRVLECFRSGQSHQVRQRASKTESITVTSRWLTLNHSLWGFMKAEVGTFQGEKAAVHTPYPTNPSTYLGTWGRTHCPWFWCRKGRPGSRVKTARNTAGHRGGCEDLTQGGFKFKGLQHQGTSVPEPHPFGPTPLRRHITEQGLGRCSSWL